ncbi:SigE family RNA polymerase sigma factor [Actinopolymorpha alba]|uniref:SigE family RNA polymerase sigma factor n=1 Tax=Actinopolymorpha alba TaxID=533267 RepID=UPI000360AE66|nr:SigE family RNA polymerase sigma factor [Actinopolymorpha alba]
MDDEAENYETFVAVRVQALLRYGYVLTGSQHDAADLVQEALVRLRTAWSRVNNKRDPEAFVRTTMARLHISAWRRWRREKSVAAVPDRAYTDSSLAETETRDQLWNELRGLPRRQRAVLVLRYYECLSDVEIARVLGISRGTVRSQAARGLAKLRSRIAQADAHDTAKTGHGAGVTEGSVQDAKA